MSWGVPHVVGVPSFRTQSRWQPRPKAKAIWGQRANGDGISKYGQRPRAPEIILPAHEHETSTCCNYSNYKKAVNRLHQAYLTEATESMARAAETVKASSSECAVSVDSTWQKRCHASLNGVVTVISATTGKCMDFQVKFKVCVACNAWSNRDKTTTEYFHWKATHVCSRIK